MFSARGMATAELLVDGSCRSPLPCATLSKGQRQEEEVAKPLSSAGTRGCRCAGLSRLSVDLASCRGVEAGLALLEHIIDGNAHAPQLFAHRRLQNRQPRLELPVLSVQLRSRMTSQQHIGRGALGGRAGREFACARTHTGDARTERHAHEEMKTRRPRDAQTLGHAGTQDDRIWCSGTDRHRPCTPQARSTPCARACTEREGGNFEGGREGWREGRAGRDGAKRQGGGRKPTPVAEDNRDIACI